jgi:hypothetical protein
MNNELCIAQRVNGKPCGRVKKTGFEFCAVHCKAASSILGPTAAAVAAVAADTNPSSTDDREDKSVYTQRQVVLQDICGIGYFIDITDHRVYHTKDIHENLTNPRVIGRWEYVSATIEASTPADLSDESFSLFLDPEWKTLAAPFLSEHI